MEIQTATNRDWQEIKEIWRRLADDKGLILTRLPARSKTSAYKWGHIQHRLFADIGFRHEDNGAVITNNLIVLDVDDPKLFQMQHKDVPETFTVQTDKGYHYYYARPDEAEYGGRVRKQFGFDIRANDGYVVAPGSIHPNGPVYKIVKDIPMAIAPEWLADLSRGGNNKLDRKNITLGNLPDVSLSKLDEETICLIMEGKPEGERSETIHRVMHQMVDAGYSNEEIVSVFMSNTIGEKAQEKTDPEGWLLDELERVLDGKVSRTLRIPEANELKIEYQRLAEYAHRDLIEMLRDYGNITSQAQEDVLKSLMLTYASMAQGELTGRIAAPLPTGFGKTTSIIAFLSRAYNMHMLGNDFTIAIAAPKIEQLCGLYESLVKAGVPPSVISLVHHKEDGSEVGLTEDGQMPEGYAAVGATKDEKGKFITDRPILLVSHTKVKGQKLDKSPSKQTFTIWDESLISTKASSLDVKDLNLGLAAFSRAAKRFEVSKETVDFVTGCHSLIEENIAEQRKTGRKSLLKLPVWCSDIAKVDVERVIKAERHRVSAKAMETLVDLIRFADSDMSVHIAQSDETVICYEVVVPDELKNIVILDASTIVNEVMLLDKSIYIPENFPEIPISYVNTKVNRIDHRAGRKAIGEALEAEELKATILEILEKHQEESVLFFTFKHRSNMLNHRAAIEDYLMDKGINIQERINGKPRFNWLTHGNETASNKYSHCSVAIFVGVLYENDHSYVSKTVGQMRDHTAVVNAGDITKIRRGSQVQAVHQGTNRCASRTIKDDVAGAVNVYYTYPDDTLSPKLKCILPDADFKVYDSEVLQPRTQKYQMVKTLAKTLKDLPSDLLKVSSRVLNQMLPELAEVSKKHRSRIMSVVSDDPSIPWNWQGRGLVRDGAQLL